MFSTLNVLRDKLEMGQFQETDPSAPCDFISACVEGALMCIKLEQGQGCETGLSVHHVMLTPLSYSSLMACISASTKS